jgi:hypothetical protein
LRQSALEVSPPFLKRAIEGVKSDEQPATFIECYFIDIAIFEDALGKRQLLRSVVDEERAIHEFASIKTRKNYLASKIKMLCPKPLAVYDALFRRSVGCHFSPKPLFSTAIYAGS